MHFIQRIKTKRKYGISCCDASELQITLAKQIVGGVQYLLDNQMGYPCEMESCEKWNEVLLKIQKGFKEWVLEGGYMKTDDIEFKSKEKEFNEATKLLGKHFLSLWN